MDYLILRILCATLAGMIMSQTGSLLQTSTRNILASPSTLGFDGLSILWILICHSILTFMQIETSIYPLLISGLILFSIVGLIFAASISRHQRIDKLIFMGLTFNLLVGAMFSLWQFLFVAFNIPFPVELWFGHFRYVDHTALVILLLVEAGILIGWFLLKEDFHLFTLGKNVAANLRLNQKKLYAFMFITIALGTFSIISLFGAFSFLGLIFPVIARRLWFPKFDLKGEFLIGAAFNGIFLMVIDFLCYFFPIFGAEIPVGLIATGVGAVSLIYLLWKSDNRVQLLAKT